jgi:hypothetical protein
MLKKRTILWAGILLLLLVAFAWAWHLYHKPHESAAGETAAVTIDADSLYHQYQLDEHSADVKYMGKVIEVTGKLVEIQHSGNAEIWIVSAQPGGGGINCQMFPGAKPELMPKPGETVRLKGRCTGFLMDVNLSDCVQSK